LAGVAIATAVTAIAVRTHFSRAEQPPERPHEVVVTPEAAGAAKSVTDFTFDLYRRVADKQPDNVFISPYSVAAALLMVSEGAKGETAAEIGRVLRFPESTLNKDNIEHPWNTTSQLKAFGSLSRSLTPGDKASPAKLKSQLKTLESQLAAVQARLQKGNDRSPDDFQKERELVEQVNALRGRIDPYELRIANALWVDQDFPLRKAYLAAVTGDYGATARPSDFRHNPEQEREAINAWASEQTKGKITEVLGPGSVTTAMRLLLTNAVYFKGAWVDPFEEENTKEEDFIAAQGRKSKVPLMSAWRDARFAEFRPDGSVNGYEKGPAPDGSEFDYSWQWADNPEGWKVLELPYEGDRLSFVAILPNSPEGVRDLEKRLDTEAVSQWIETLQMQEVRQFLPRFRLENQYDLRSDLTELGMPSAFAPGGLTGVSDDPEAKLLAISGAIHVTFVEVNEKGTEAAAVTAFPAPASAPAEQEPPKPPAVFRADHPFVFLIRDVKSGAILFIGRMAQP